MNTTTDNLPPVNTLGDLFREQGDAFDDFQTSVQCEEKPILERDYNPEEIFNLKDEDSFEDYARGLDFD